VAETPRQVTLLTDYGPGSEHVGALHAVLAATCPSAGRVDLAHDVPAGDVRWGAILLARLAPLLPGAVHVAVVDPGVGTDRRGLAVLLAGGGALVGPDNGLLGPAAGVIGAVRAVELTSPAHRRAPVAPTFHGRDVFAPAAAHLALGGDPGALGPAVDPDGVAHPAPAPARAIPGRLAALVAGRDRFGNLALLAGPDDLAAAGLVPGARVVVRAGGAARAATVGRVFADVPPGALLVHLDAHGMVAVAVNGGDAAAALGAAPGAWVSLEAAEP
jgi:S-adenosylmethionine hydrolase